MNIVIVTQCPSGMTTSYMAGQALLHAAANLHWQAAAEIHTRVQAATPLSTAQIASADLVVIAADGAVETQRFRGARVYRGSIAAALEDPRAWLQQAAREAEVLPAPESAAGADDTSAVVVPQAAEPRAAESRAAVPRADLLRPGATAPAGTTAGTATRIVAVTACPTGVAHTFMAAEALQEAARALGHVLKVETRGSVGASNTLTPEDIANADLVVLAVDIEVDSAPFAGKRVYRTSTGTALKNAREVLSRALREARIESASDKTASEKISNGGAETVTKEKTGAYKHLMTGVSFMLPVVVAGGLSIALSFVFGIEAFKVEGTLAAALMQIGGGSAFALMIPVLAGYIAYSIADRPGLAPGLIGGMLASTLGAGFLGGIVAGFLAGYSAKFLVTHIQLPKTLEALKPILVIPLVASLFTGLVMIYVIGTPVAAIMTAMTDFLKSMGSANAVLLGIILGSMMCFDLGGPVNKAAYTFGVGLLASHTYGPMAAIMAAGMVPAIGMGLATFLGKRKFTANEHEAGRASFALGLCFISEGAIPFAAKDPLRVIPACIAGGALTGALSMLVNAELMAPHGGIFVLFIPNAISHVFWYVGAIAAGSLVTASLYLLLKDRRFKNAPVGV